MVEAHSEAALRARRNIVELLLAEAPNSRAIQDLAARVGVTHSRYPMRNNDCVLCGRCVRVCDEIWQSKSLGLVGRGRDRRVALPFDSAPGPLQAMQQLHPGLSDDDNARAPAP